jgi:hypothetical protein
MKTSWKLAAVAAGAAAALSAVPASAAAVPAAHAVEGPVPAVFVQTDSTGGNTIVAYDRTASGGLDEAGWRMTGARGCR